jgi:hypothetical protein
MKSKVKIIIVVTIMLLIGILLAIPKSTYESWFNKDNTPVDDVPNTEKYTRMVYLKNTGGKLVGVNVEVDELEEDEILQKWNLLTSNSDMLPTGYTSVINKDAVLNSYEIKENLLVLDVSPEIKLSSGRSAVESLAWTFINDEITEVALVVNGERLKEVMV